MNVFTIEQQCIKVNLGEPFAVRVPVVATAGYELTVDADREAFSVEIIDLVQDNPSSIGGDGISEARIVALKPGTHELTFLVQRCWEDLPDRATRMKVVVEN